MTSCPLPAIKRYKTYMWKEERGEKIYRIQTEDPLIFRRLNKRQDMTLVMWGINKYLKVFQVTYYSPKEARRSFKRIVGSKNNITKKLGVFCGLTSAIRDIS